MTLLTYVIVLGVLGGPSLCLVEGCWPGSRGLHPVTAFFLSMLVGPFHMFLYLVMLLVSFASEFLDLAQGTWEAWKVLREEE